MRVLIRILLVLAVLGIPGPVTAQVGDGATLTVLRGEVALLRPDGGTIQPAPSGSMVVPGDEIRTLNATGALITFYAGTEIELGPQTILVVDRVSLQGGRVDISLKQVLGTTLSRVQSLTEPSSAYRIEAGGSVAVIRGSTLAVRGPEITPNGVFVSMVCLDCGSESYVQEVGGDERAPLGPEARGYTWGVASRPGGGPEKRGDFEPFKVDRALGPIGNAAGAITTAQQHAAIGPGQGPPGRDPAGQHRDRGGRGGQERRDPGRPPPPLAPCPPEGPEPPPGPPC